MNVSGSDRLRDKLKHGLSTAGTWFAKNCGYAKAKAGLLSLLVSSESLSICCNTCISQNPLECSPKYLSQNQLPWLTFSSLPRLVVSWLPEIISLGHSATNPYFLQAASMAWPLIKRCLLLWGKNRRKHMPPWTEWKAGYNSQAEEIHCLDSLQWTWRTSSMTQHNTLSRKKPWVALSNRA